MTRIRILIIHGAPFLFARSPLDTYFLPKLQYRQALPDSPLYGTPPPVFLEGHGNLHIGALADPAIDTAFVVTHSHAGEYFRIFARRLGKIRSQDSLKLYWWPIDSVKFTEEQDPDEISPAYSPQCKNLPLVIPDNITGCAAFHRKLPFDRRLAAQIPMVGALADFPFNSLCQAEDGRVTALTDTELSGSVATALDMLSQAPLPAPAKAALFAASILQAQIDHNSIVAAATPTILDQMECILT
jgi:hypothetical protein